MTYDNSKDPIIGVLSKRDLHINVFLDRSTSKEKGRVLIGGSRQIHVLLDQ